MTCQGYQTIRADWLNKAESFKMRMGFVTVTGLTFRDARLSLLVHLKIMKNNGWGLSKKVGHKRTISISIKEATRHGSGKEQSGMNQAEETDTTKEEKAHKNVHLLSFINLDGHHLDGISQLIEIW